MSYYDWDKIGKFEKKILKILGKTEGFAMTSVEIDSFITNHYSLQKKPESNAYWSQHVSIALGNLLQDKKLVSDEHVKGERKIIYYSLPEK